MGNKILILVLVIIGYLTFFTSCANIGMPSGGIKDSIPPYVVHSVPNFNQVKFNDQKIKITFNEFVVVDGLSEKFIVSPPSEKKPIIRTKGKSIIVDLNEKLKANTTYSLDFKDGVADNNEHNPLKNLRLAFSTGPVLDSLRIVGFVKDAFNLEPIPNAYILLYKGTSDTLVYTTKPDFVGKTNREGFFAITNLPADTFQVYSLSSSTGNLKFTPGADSIAFNKVRIAPSAIKRPAKDSTYVAADSLVVMGRTRFAPGPLYLMRFGEDFFSLSLDKYNHPSRKIIDFTFTQSVADTFNIEPLNFKAKDGWKYTEMSAKSDSVRIWLTDSMDYKKDTLIFKVSYLQQDTLKQFYTKNDTLRFYFTDVVQQVKNKHKERRKVADLVSTITLSTNVRVGFDVYDKLLIESPEPIQSFDTTMIKLFEKRDSLYKPIKFVLKPDSINKRKFRLSYPWRYARDYKLTIDSAAITTIYCADSKAVKLEFKSQEEEHYGKLLLDMKNITSPTIIQLLAVDKRETVLQSQRISKDEVVTFKFLEPSKFMLKAIFDQNDNGKWDHGNLKERIAPEEVVYYPNVVKIRSNWDIKESWNIPKVPTYSKKIYDEELEQQRIKELQNRRKKKSAL